MGMFDDEVSCSSSSPTDKAENVAENEKEAHWMDSRFVPSPLIRLHLLYSWRIRPMQIRYGPYKLDSFRH